MISVRLYMKVVKNMGAIRRVKMTLRLAGHSLDEGRFVNLLHMMLLTRKKRIMKTCKNLKFYLYDSMLSEEKRTKNITNDICLKKKMDLAYFSNQNRGLKLITIERD